MPYAVIEDLLAGLRGRLPRHAQEIYRAAFNAAWQSYHEPEPDEREETAHRVAWADVKHKYRKSGDRWISL